MNFFKIQNVYFSQTDDISDDESEFEIDFNAFDINLLKLY